MAEQPFVRLLRSPYATYAYDVNRNEVLSVPEEVYQALERILLDGQPLGDEIPRCAPLRRLTEKGYFSTFHPEKIEHGMTHFLQEAQNRRMSQLILQLTQNCNFRCRYCAYSNFDTGRQRSHANARMSEATAKAAVDFFFAHSLDAEDPVIGFYGGEPLLEFDTLKAVVKYAESRFAGRKHRYNITTNGSLFTDEIAFFLLKYDFAITISIDGPKEIHDKNRKLADLSSGTFDLVIRNLERVTRDFPAIRDKIMINMVVDPKNDADCANDLFVDYTVFDRDRMNATLVNTDFLDEDFSVTDAFQAKSEYNLFLAMLSQFRPIDSAFISPLAQVFHNRMLSDIERMYNSPSLDAVLAPGGPCIPGVLRLFVDVNGRLFPCERCSETSSIMNLGDLEHGLDLEKSKRVLNVAQLAPEECRNCWALLRCAICAAQVEEGDHFSLEKKHARCRQIQAEADSFLKNKIALYEMGQIERRRKERA